MMTFVSLYFDQSIGGRGSLIGLTAILAKDCHAVLGSG